MPQPGYKQLLSYKLADIAFQIGWESCPPVASAPGACRRVVPAYIEGSSERSLSSKLKLYDVAKASSMEALEDFEDILKLGRLPRWDKTDQRLKKLRYLIESYPSIPPTPSTPSVASISEVLGGQEGLEGREKTEAIANYLIDVITRGGYMLDKQINAVEEKHTREGGYNEKLLRKRLAFRAEKY